MNKMNRTNDVFNWDLGMLRSLLDLQPQFVKLLVSELNFFFSFLLYLAHLLPTEKRECLPVIMDRCNF